MFVPDRIICHGVILKLLELERNAKYGVIVYLAEGEAAFQEYAVLTRAAEIASGDLAAIAAGALPDAELEINRPYVELELCNNEQAIAFYETFKGYADRTSSASEITDAESLKDWASQMYAWRLEAWSCFYEKPCGAIEILINIFEIASYSYTLLRQGGLGDAYHPALEAFIKVSFDIAETDMAVIESSSNQ